MDMRKRMTNQEDGAPTASTSVNVYEDACSTAKSTIGTRASDMGDDAKMKISENKR